METVRDFIMYWLDPIGIVVGLVLAVPVFWTWIPMLQDVGRRRE